MRRVTSHALLGPALLLYLLADAAATQGQLDPAGALIACVVALLSLSPGVLERRRELPGALRVGWLGLSCGAALLPAVAPAARSLGIELVSGLAASAAAALVLDLALCLPDELGSPSRALTWRRITRALSAVCALIGAAAYAPAFELLGRTWVVPSRVALVPLVWLGVALVAALVLRALRRRLGSTPEALASSAWALLGLWPSATLMGVAGVAYALGSPLSGIGPRAALALCALVLTASHLRLIDPRRRLSVGPTTREIVAGVLVVALIAALAVLVRPLWPSEPLPLAVWIAATLLLAAALQRVAREAVAVMLSPAGGRLLAALDQGHAQLGSCGDMLAVARVALRTARASSGDASAEPVLFLFSPARTLRSDAAGEPHSSRAAAHPELLARLRAQPGELLQRGPLEAQFVRAPALRPLIEALRSLDALCVLPLVQAGELEAALVFPRAARRSPLALEELEALQRFGRHLTGFVAVLCADARAQQRAEQTFARVSGLESELAQTRDELERARTELRLLRAGGAGRGLSAAGVAYGPAMRALFAQLKRTAELHEPVLLWGERGVELEPLATVLHEQGPRAHEPLVLVDCASVRPEAGASALLGSDGTPGWLALAGRGTLVLRDLPALSREAQQALSGALSARRTRVIATARRAPDALCADGALEPELRGRFRAALRVPSLRDRREDLPSLLLLALDRSARVLGKPAVGIEADAQARLLVHDWPGNCEELDAVIERSVARCEGPRVRMQDLPTLGQAPRSAPTASQLDGTLERVEKRVLRRALERANGNKSEAARLLGLKRTTFLDKLRRNGLEPEEGAQGRSGQELS
jgi:DNA-binding NtrC family response regulator